MARVIHFEISADDPKRAVRFYEQALGWKFEEYPGGHGTSLWTAHATAWLELALRHMRPVR